MAYTDPTLVRKHTTKLSFNDEEHALIDAFCRFTGKEKAALLRALVLNHITEALGAPAVAEANE